MRTCPTQDAALPIHRIGYSLGIMRPTRAKENQEECILSRHSPKILVPILLRNQTLPSEEEKKTIYGYLAYTTWVRLAFQRPHKIVDVDVAHDVEDPK